ncbi:IclR family transcriptional regulator [Mycolicibacterium baixiangningiae]|uniref:IclR family transcriptional regulator n=1 Tax=Mycolicibacterium baixiangningiae TaxID=2761578 RepID=UPI0018664DBD|nr:IclR family transcriptional regulator [Mycolicibacterium baixiangningiae]
MATMANATDGPVKSVKYPVESVANAARILLMLSSDTQLKLSDVADHLGTSPSTAHRLLTTLEASGFLHQHETTRCYEPGDALRTLAAAIAPERSRWDFALPYLQELSERVDETVNLQVLHGSDIAFVESAESTAALRVGSRRGAIMPAHATSGGKILLAQLDSEQLEALLAQNELTRLTDDTISDTTTFLNELKRVRKRGYATNLGESEPGIGGVAVAVPTDGRPARYALAVSVPTSRLSRSRIPALVSELMKTAALLSESDPDGR